MESEMAIRTSRHPDRQSFGTLIYSILSALQGTTALTGASSSPTGGGTYILDRALGVAVTLPAATGTGLKQRFVVKTAASGGSYVISAAGTDVFQGGVSGFNSSSGATLTFSGAAASNNNTVTLDGTNGAVAAGEYVEFTDVRTGVWIVNGMLEHSAGAFSTPFSHV
jgi:hypothetical protein